MGVPVKREAGLQSAMPMYKQVEAIVYFEVSASKKQKTMDDYFNYKFLCNYILKY